MNDATLYEKAILEAARYHAEFYKAHSAYMEHKTEGDQADLSFYKFKLDRLDQEAQKAAARTCAQQELICALFGKTDEQVHADLEAATRKEN